MRQRPDQRRDEYPIGRPAARPRDLPPQYRQLVAQDKDLDLFRGLRAATQHRQHEEVPKQPVET
jgi:hypothetical protein